MSEQANESVEIMIIKHNEDFDLPSEEELMRIRNLATENQKIKARIARLEKGLDYAGVKLINHKDQRSFEFVDKILCETAPQSVAEIQAQAIEGLIDARYPEGYNETDKIRVGFMLCRINQLRQQAKDNK